MGGLDTVTAELAERVVDFFDCTKLLDVPTNVSRLSGASKKNRENSVMVIKSFCRISIIIQTCFIHSTHPSHFGPHTGNTHYNTTVCPCGM